VADPKKEINRQINIKMQIMSIQMQQLGLIKCSELRLVA